MSPIEKLKVWRDTLIELNAKKEANGITEEDLIRAHEVMDFKSMLIVLCELADSHRSLIESAKAWDAYHKQAQGK